MRLALAFATVLASTSVASSAPAPTPTPATPSTDSVADDHAVAQDRIAVALAANLPFFWSDAQSVGVSGYIGFARQHALRLNVATHRYSAPALGIIADLAADGDEGSYSGRITDLGIGYQYFTKGMFDGWTFEAGVLRRALDTRVEDEYAPKAIVETDAAAYAVRGFVGYSWLWQQRLFVSLNVGASVGRYAGTERTASSTYMPEYRTEDFVRVKAAGEAYLRFGLAFGL